MSRTIDLESARSQEQPLNLAELADVLHWHFRGSAPLGYVQGKTQLRDAVIQLLGCSSAHAEAVVDQLQARHFIRYADDPGQAGGGHGPWIIDAQQRPDTTG